MICSLQTALVELPSDEQETPVDEEDGGFTETPADDVTESSARDDFEEDDDEEEEEESRLRGGRFRSERRTDEFKMRRSETIPDNLGLNSLIHRDFSLATMNTSSPEMPTHGQASMMTSASHQPRPNFPRKRGRGKQFGARHHMHMGGRFMRAAGPTQVKFKSGLYRMPFS